MPPMHHVRTQRKGGLAHVVQASLGLPAFQMNPRAARLGRRRRADGCSAMGGCGVLVAAPGHVGPAEGGLGRQCRHAVQGNDSVQLSWLCGFVALRGEGRVMLPACRTAVQNGHHTDAQQLAMPASAGPWLICSAAGARGRQQAPIAKLVALHAGPCAGGGSAHSTARHESCCKGGKWHLC